MAKKKLLNEAQVRRFMGLAGIKPIGVNNVIQEMGMNYEDEKDPADAEAPVGLDAPGDEMGGMDEPGEEMAAMDDPGEEMAAGELDLDPAEIKSAADGLRAAAAVMDQLEGAVGEEDAEAALPADEPEGEMSMEPDVAAADEPGEEDMELQEVELELSEEEIVQEVARRVAKRIIKAKKAKAALDEALGKK